METTAQIPQSTTTDFAESILQTNENLISRKQETCIHLSEKIEAYWNGSILILIDRILQQCFALHSNEDTTLSEEFIEDLFGEEEFSEYFNEPSIPEFNQYLAAKIDDLVNKFTSSNSDEQPLSIATSLMFVAFMIENRGNEEVKKKLDEYVENESLSLPRMFSDVDNEFGLSGIDATLFYDSKFTRVIVTSNAMLGIHFVPKYVFFKFRKDGKKSFSQEIAHLKAKGFQIQKKKVSENELKFDIERLQKDDFKIIKITEQYDEYDAREMFKAASAKNKSQASLKHCQS